MTASMATTTAMAVGGEIRGAADNEKEKEHSGQDREMENMQNWVVVRPGGSSTAGPSGGTAQQDREKPPQRVKFLLVSCERISVRPSNKTVSSFLSRLPGSAYDLRENLWTFELCHYQPLCAELAKAQVLYDQIPPGTLRIAAKSIPNEHFVLEGAPFDQLLPFQREAVRFALNRSGRVLLADDMGLGKTIQALAIATFYRNEFPLLIVAPASLLATWTDAAACFLDEEPVVVKHPGDLGSKISLISYNQATTLSDVLRRRNFNVVICDECHSLKHMKSKRTTLLLPLLQQSARLIMISGTPAESRPMELFSILRALDRTVFPSVAAYGARYCGARLIGTIYDYSGSTNASELAIVLEKAFMIRRMKAAVITGLPTKRRSQFFITTPSTAVLSEDEALMLAFARAAELKKEKVLEHVGSLLERNIKMIVFAHHQVMLDALQEFCDSRACPCIRIDGSTSLARRRTAVEAFQSNSGVRVAILSIRACSTGLTLTAATTTVFAELFWNPGTLLQAEDRIHRIGQTAEVDIHYLLAKNTVDERVWPHILKKMTVLESLGIGNEDFEYDKVEVAARNKSIFDFINTKLT